MPHSRILIVEDEFIIAELIKDTLEAMGHVECTHAASVEAGLDAADDGHWAGALLDVRLNGVPVFPVAERLFARGAPFIFCTGDSDTIEFPAHFAAAPILPKPWGPGQLERMAQEMLSAP
jgi:DNA-binding response OmpR family regulator